MRTVLIACMVILLFTPVVCAEKLQIVTGEWLPYVSEDLEDLGFAVEVVRAAFNAVGIESEFQFMTWKKCERLVRIGKAFAAVPYIKTDARTPFAIFSDPIGTSVGVFFYRKNDLGKLDYEKLADLKKYKILGGAGYWYKPLFSKNDLNVDYNLKNEMSFKKLYWGLADLVAENQFVGWGLIGRMFPGEQHLFMSSKSFSKDTLHLMASKKYPNSKTLLEQFNKGLKIIHSSGIYNSLLEKYEKQELKIKEEAQTRFRMKMKWNYR